jgi:hypothetical protein
LVKATEAIGVKYDEQGRLMRERRSRFGKDDGVEEEGENKTEQQAYMGSEDAHC